MPASARAAVDDGALLMPPTSTRDVFFLFSKLSGRDPQIENRVKATKEYGAAGIADRNKFSGTISELQSAYLETKAENAVIVVRTAVNIHINTDTKTLNATLSGIDMPNARIYFPYRWYGADVAVIPDVIEPYMDVPLSQEETEDAAAKNGSNRATMVVELKPVKADGKTQMNLDGVNQWLLLGHVVGVTYYSQDLQEIWSWKDKNYRRSSRESQLIDLKKN